MSDLDRSAPPWTEPAAHQPSVATSGTAVASLVLGIVGLLVPLVCSLIALWLGYWARREIDAGRQGGRGLATAGVVLGWIGVAILAGLVVLGVGEWHVSVG